VTRQLEGKGCVVLAWQEVLAAFLAPTPTKKLDPTTEVLLGALIDFVHDKVGFISKFTHWYPHFRRSWTPNADQYQRALLWSLREVFPNPSNKISAGATWAGYYFATILPRRDQGWFGFVPSVNVTGGAKREHAAELIVATTFDVPSLPASAFVSVSVPGILGRGVACNAWILNFDKQWSSPEKWRGELDPLWKKVESLQEQAISETRRLEPNPPQSLASLPN